jgi:type II secretory pathway component PulF
MAVFEYSAVDVDTSPVAGTVVADTPQEARDQLRDRGLTITRIAAASMGGRGLFPSRLPWGLRAETVSFIRELATLLAAGIPVLSVLGTLSQQHSRRLKVVIQQLADRIAAGVGLAEAMKQHPLYFDELCTSVVAVGESTGALETALRRLADFKERSQRLRNRVTTALVYPAIVSLVGLAVVAFLMTYVIPNLLGTLEQSGKQLPAITRAVKAISDLLLGGWWLILILAGTEVIALKAAMRSDAGKRIAHRLILKAPLVGDLVRKETTSRIAIVLAALLRNGLQFVSAVQITRRTIGNVVFRRALEDYEAAVASGKDIADPLKRTGVFAPMVVQMLAVGQHAGNLEEMLEQLAQTYDQEVATATTRLTSILEPVLIIILAVMVGFIALATVLPILEISNVL